MTVDESAVSPPEDVPIHQLIPGFSPRLDGEDPDHIETLVKSDNQHPPILVHRATMQVIDGMHRLRAAMRRGDETVTVAYFDGSEDHAFLLAVKNNSCHGLPLKPADREAAVQRVFQQHPNWSDRAIAMATGISSKTVAAIRQRSAAADSPSKTRLGLDGRVRPLNASEGRLRASEAIADNPDASLREIARAAGISVATARDVRERLRSGRDPLPRGHQEARTRGLAEPSTESRRPAVDPRTIVTALKRDPSMRFNEAGRFVLRLLEVHALRQEDWAKLATHVPAHWVEDLLMLAKEHETAWEKFAKHLEHRLKDGVTNADRDIPRTHRQEI